MIEARGLTKRYGDKLAVDNISFTVEPGTVTGFLGPNGAGKSTTMKLLLGLTRPTSGTMSVLGHPVSPRSPLPAGAIGSLIEGPSYYPRLTGPENLAMVADYLGLPRGRVQHALATVNRVITPYDAASALTAQPTLSDIDHLRRVYLFLRGERTLDYRRGLVDGAKQQTWQSRRLKWMPLPENETGKTNN